MDMGILQIIFFNCLVNCLVQGSKPQVISNSKAKDFLDEVFSFLCFFIKLYQFLLVLTIWLT